MEFFGKLFGGAGPMGLDMGFWWPFGIEFAVRLIMIIVFWTCFSPYRPPKNMKTTNTSFWLYITNGKSKAPSELIRMALFYYRPIVK